MNWHNVLLRPQNLYEELLRRKLISGGGVPAVLQTITGISPLTLLNVASKGIKSLTQFGKCEQASTPTPSVPVDIKCNNGAVKVGREIYTTPLGRTVYGGTLDVTSGVLTVDRAMVDLGTLNWMYYSPYAMFLAAVVDQSSSVDKSGVCSQYPSVDYYVNSTAWANNDKILTLRASDLNVRIKDTAYSNATDFKTAMSGVQLVYELATPQTYQLTPQTVEMIVERSMFQSNAGGNIDITYYANGILKTVSGNPVVITDADGQNAEDVTVHIEPIQSGSGTPSPTNIRPISGMTDINITRLGGVVVDGTPEVLTVTGKNLFDISAYDDASDWTGTPYKYIAIPLQNGQYTISWDKSKGGGFYWLVQVDGAVKGTSNVGSGGSWLWHDTNTSLQNETFTFTVTEGYVYFSYYGRYFVQKFLPALETVQIEKGSTATAYEPYFAQTASDIPMLLSVGNYKDEGELISGLLTHKCGVKVLTSANIATFSNGCFFVNIDDKKEGKETTLSTHFTYAAGASSTIAVGEMGASGGASKSTFYKVGGVTSKAEAGAWVDGQYANGTPVIVVYPLAETTTEQVTAQHLRARDTATITAVTNNISDITLEVQYWQNAE